MSSVTLDTRKELIQIILDNLHNNNSIFQHYVNPYIFKPHNPFTKNYYSGYNRLMLALIADRFRLEDPRWATYKQIKKHGLKLKKDALYAYIEKFGFYKPNDVDEDERMLSYVKNYKVFNFQFIEGVSKFNQTAEFVDSNNLYKRIACNSICTIEYKITSYAYYQPNADKIIMPYLNHFLKESDAIQVLLHEMIHATGNSSRLNRNLSYNLEEIVAEIGSLFFLIDYGVNLDQFTLTNSSAYVNSYAYTIDRPNDFVKSLGLANKASDYLLERISFSVGD